MSTMKELYKVRNINISLLDETTNEPLLEIPCDFGMIKDNGGILFLETHIFNDEDYDNFNFNRLGCPASARMLSFDDVEIEIPFMAFTKKTGKEHEVIFRCFDYIIVHEQDIYYALKKSEEPEMIDSQLLRIDLWGLDLLISPDLSTTLIVSDAPFEMVLYTDEENGGTYIHFPCNKDVVHNTLTEELFKEFRYSLMGYLSLINGASVQITKEYYNGYFKIYSYDRMENLSRFYYTCGNAQFVRLSSSLVEFDNYVRWNKVLNLNKFVHHICTSQQVKSYEDSSFILILAFEGLCKKYLEIQNEEKVPRKVVSKSSFKVIRKELLDIVNNHSEISSQASVKFKNNIERLNSSDLATKKFSLLLDDLNIEQTDDIIRITKQVRSTLVHEAELKDYSDYQLLSEVIIESILRLICSKIDRHSYFKDKVIKGEVPNLSFQEFVNEKKLNVNEEPIFNEYDKRIKGMFYKLTC